MAIDTAEKRRCVGWNMPTPDGTISIFDRRHVAGNYRGLPIIGVSVGGGITPSGAVANALTAYRSFGGGITPSGDLARALTAYRSFGGTVTPSGILGTILTIVMDLSGELDLSGALSGRNPAWLILDDALIWMGEWDEAWSYNINDVVLYKYGDEWHVFVSKIGHNVGNIPTSTAVAWRRLYQEQWL